MIGASGAISAVLGAYLVLFPRARIQSLVFLGLFYELIAVPAVHGARLLVRSPGRRRDRVPRGPAGETEAWRSRPHRRLRGGRRRRFRSGSAAGRGGGRERRGGGGRGKGSRRARRLSSCGSNPGAWTIAPSPRSRWSSRASRPHADRPARPRCSRRSGRADPAHLDRPLGGEAIAMPPGPGAERPLTHDLFAGRWRSSASAWTGSSSPARRGDLPRPARLVFADARLETTPVRRTRSPGVRLDSPSIAAGGARPGRDRPVEDGTATRRPRGARGAATRR